MLPERVSLPSWFLFGGFQKSLECRKIRISAFWDPGLGLESKRGTVERGTGVSREEEGGKEIRKGV
jgi:hypothetical protein